ncbi:hypothetical protein HAX54_028495 [Datura stramonium]|uniref:Uncharacterized protein n=1 Tax=Datura stramonium TaxID=4076 RepID=A0ABS8S9M6_DATST|nr:hypothetical protein [Datura stramonium]
MGNMKFGLWVFFVMVNVTNGCWEEERSALLELQEQACAGQWRSRGRLGSDHGKCPGLSNLRVLLVAGYGINDINILSMLEKVYRKTMSFVHTMSLPIFHLKHLDLSRSNEIHGEIEMTDIIALSNLEFLDLQMNNFESFVTTKGSSKRMRILYGVTTGVQTQLRGNMCNP